MLCNNCDKCYKLKNNRIENSYVSIVKNYCTNLGFIIAYVKQVVNCC